MKQIVFCTGLSVILALVGFSLSFAKPNVTGESVNEAFEVKIQVFSADDRSPSAEHQIVFENGVIYLFPNDPLEPVTLIDSHSQKVILIDQSNNLHAAIKTEDLLRMTATLRSSADTDALRERMGIDAQVHKDSSGRYAVNYGGIEYSTTTQQPSDPKWSLEFGQFADWASRLNIAQKRGLPPFGRMLMNSQIAADGLIPLETTVTFQQNGQSVTYRSTHQVVGGVSNDSRLKISEANQCLALSRGVTLQDFTR